MLYKNKKAKLIVIILMFNLICQVILPIFPIESIAVEEVSEITRNYEIKEEETWDVSVNNDGSVMAKWTRNDRTIVISGTGEMKDWQSNSKEDWHNTQYTNVVEKVVIEEGITRIRDSAFSICISLESVIIPESVARIESAAFKGCSNLKEIKVNGNNKNYSDENGILFSKDKTEIIRYPAGKKDVTQYSIPEGVTSIERYAFLRCSSLESITIPESVTFIGYDVFSRCSKLKEIKVNENNKNYTDENGILFSKDKKGIIKYPEGKKDVTQYSIPEGVTSIGYNTFYECSNLENITIPEGVTIIDEYAFYECSSIERIIVPEGVTIIGSYAFEGCSSLESITIPDGVTSIREKTFSGCSSLKSITIPEGVTSIGSSAFSGCSSLESITIPEGVTIIGSYAFSGCSSLENITIPKGVTSIGRSAFSGCSSLENITIPEGVTSIGSHAFSGCSSLESITIPEGVTSIGSSAFFGCSSLENITIPETVTMIGSGAIDETTIIYCKSNTEGHRYAEEGERGYILEGEATNIATNYEIKEEETWDVSENNDGSVMAKWTRNDRTIVISGTGEMKGWKFGSKEDWHKTKYINAIKKVVIEEGVTSIREHTFAGCRRLESIIIPEGVTSIGGYAFYRCSGIKSITIPESVTSIGSNAFYGCSSIESITIPEGVTSIEFHVFEGCSSLKSITIPEGVTIIYDDAFSGCSSLKSITIPEGVTNIRNNAFSGCCSLESITIPNSVTFIGDKTLNQYEVFNGCVNLKEIKVSEKNKKYTDENGILFSKDKKEIIRYPEGKKDVTQYSIPEGVITIGEDAFYGCNSIESITIPDGVTSIGDNAFEGCSSIENITIPEGVTNIGNYAFSDCSSIESIIIPDGVTSIERDAFSDCISLKSITIPEGVLTIGYNAFSDCSSLESITIPEGVTSIGSYAFSDCSSIESIIIPDGVTSIGSYAIDDQTMIYCKSNTEGHRYAEESEQGYIIDELAPICKVTYSPTEKTKEKVIVTITSNEHIQQTEGWTLSQDKLKLTKEYSTNKEETITVKDLAGNESQVSIKITNIILRGDINEDGQINTVDMTKILRHIAVSKSQQAEAKNPTWKLTGEKFTIADINEDGEVNTVDLSKILRHISASKDSGVAQRHPDWLLIKE